MGLILLNADDFSNSGDSEVGGGIGIMKLNNFLVITLILFNENKVAMCHFNFVFIFVLILFLILF